MNKARYILSLTITTVLVIIFFTDGLQADDGIISDGKRLLQSSAYEQALTYFLRIAGSEDCDYNCRSEAHLYAGYSLYMLGKSDGILKELRESVKLRPQYRIFENDFPAEFVQYYERARRDLLCTVRINILTPDLIAMAAEDHVFHHYTFEDVLAGDIILSDSRYSGRQLYKLIPGTVNTFELELEQHRDFYFYDSLYLKLRPTMTETEIQPPDIGKIDVEFLRNNYDDHSLARIIVGSDESYSIIHIFEVRPEWYKLVSDVRAYPAKNRLDKVLKIGSAAGAVIAGALAIYRHSQLDDAYDHYLTAVDKREILSSYDNYESKVKQRNLLTGIAIGLASMEVIWYLFTPQNQKTLIDAYERRHGMSGISLKVGDDIVGLQMHTSF